MKFIILFTCIFAVGCDVYVDPKQIEEAYKICGGKDNTKHIWVETGRWSTDIDTVNCTNGAEYTVVIRPEGKQVKVFK